MLRDYALAMVSETHEGMLKCRQAVHKAIIDLMLVYLVVDKHKTMHFYKMK